MDNKIFQVELQIIINKNLYKKKIIDENTFVNANNLLLNKLKLIKGDTYEL